MDHETHSPPTAAGAIDWRALQWGCLAAVGFTAFFGVMLFGKVLLGGRGGPGLWFRDPTHHSVFLTILAVLATVCGLAWLGMLRLKTKGYNPIAGSDFSDRLYGDPPAEPKD